jgi:hypothetical protein
MKDLQLVRLPDQLILSVFEDTILLVIPKQKIIVETIGEGFFSLWDFQQELSLRNTAGA